jgi:hypothetical protein
MSFSMVSREQEENVTAQSSRLDQVTAIGDDIILRGGSCSGICHREEGAVPVQGRWTTTDVRVGDSWKILTENRLDRAAEFVW